MIVGAFFFGLVAGAYIATEMIDRFVVRKIWGMAEYWRSEHVKAKWEAIAAKEQIVKERNDDIRSADYWKHTED